MKVMVVSFLESNNYGAVLQSFALTRFLNKQHDVQMLRYSNSNAAKGMRPIRFAWNKVGIYRAFIDILHVKARCRKVRAFRSFIHENIQMTRLLSSTELFSHQDLGYDAYISGSDQIWNPSKTGGKVDPVYFLAFGPDEAKKISYASSMGDFDVENFDHAQQIKDYLLRFSSISTRESDVAQRLEKFLGRPVAHVLDPVLLLPKEEWQTICAGKEICPQRPYLLVYTVANNPGIPVLARRIAQKNNWLLCMVGDATLNSHSQFDRVFSWASPEEFVALFMNAAYVVTNSFHGTAFAVNFGVPFSVVKAKVENRISSLLTMLGLQTRLIASCDEPIDETCSERTQAATLLEQERAASMKFLIDAMEE